MTTQQHRATRRVLRIVLVGVLLIDAEHDGLGEAVGAAHVVGDETRGVEDPLRGRQPPSVHGPVQDPRDAARGG